MTIIVAKKSVRDSKQHWLHASLFVRHCKRYPRTFFSYFCG